MINYFYNFAYGSWYYITRSVYLKSGLSNLVEVTLVWLFGKSATVLNFRNRREALRGIVPVLFLFRTRSFFKFSLHRFCLFRIVIMLLFKGCNFKIEYFSYEVCVSNNKGFFFPISTLKDIDCIIMECILHNNLWFNFQASNVV